VRACYYLCWSRVVLGHDIPPISRLVNVIAVLVPDEVHHNGYVVGWLSVRRVVYRIHDHKAIRDATEDDGANNVGQTLLTLLTVGVPVSRRIVTGVPREVQHYVN
jgi:hypothetical protein